MIHAIIALLIGLIVYWSIKTGGINVSTKHLISKTKQKK